MVRSRHRVSGAGVSNHGSALGVCGHPSRRSLRSLLRMRADSMLRYTLHRILLMIPTLIGVAVLVFFMLRVVPGDVVEVKLRGDGGNVSQQTIDFERKRLGLDKPIV